MRNLLVLVLALVTACGGTTTVEPLPDGDDMMPGMPWMGRSRDRWTPDSLGTLAHWTADARFVTLSGGNVTRWRNHVDGRSGVLVPDSGDSIAWVSAFGPAGRPAAKLAGNDRILEETSTLAPSALATSIAHMRGTNVPISALMTLRTVVGVQQHPLLWLDGGGLARMDLRITAADNLLEVERIDDAGGSLDIAGFTELGTSIRRIGVTFDGSHIVGYVDTQEDFSSSSFGTLGALSPNMLFVRDISGAPSADFWVYDIVILPRAITAPEWSRYYAWSVKQWGTL